MPHREERSILSRVGQGLIAFGAGTTSSNIDTIRANRDLAQSQAELGQQQVTAGQTAAQRDLDIQNLIGVAMSDRPDKDQALTRLFQISPEIGDQIFEGIGARSTFQREDAARRAAEIQSASPERRPQIIQRQAEELRAQGRDPSDTESLLTMTPQEQDNVLRFTQAAALSAKERLGLDGGEAEPFALRTFRGLAESAGLAEDELAEAARVQLGLDPRAVGSAEQTIAVDEELKELVAEMRETLAERTKFAERTGASRATAIDKGFTSIQSLDKNIRNIDRAITELEGGASTGVIESRFFPSIREASVILDQIQGELALDVVGSVTFGALSKGELDLARSTALPTGLQPPALIGFLQERKAAQGKLRQYYTDQIDFLDQGGSIAGFLRSQQRGTVSGEVPEGEFDPALLEFMTPEQRALFEQ